MYVLIYLIIGFVIAAINNHLWSKLETSEEKNSDNPVMIIALVLWILFWPLGLISTVVMLSNLLKNKY